jgi:hypothetical protein
MIEINWDSFILVAGVAIGASAVVTTFFAIGVRLLTNSARLVRNMDKNKTKSSRIKVQRLAFQSAAVLSFLVASSILAYGLFVIVTFSRAS